MNRMKEDQCIDDQNYSQGEEEMTASTQCCLSGSVSQMVNKGTPEWEPNEFKSSEEQDVTWFGCEDANEMTFGDGNSSPNINEDATNN